MALLKSKIPKNIDNVTPSDPKATNFHQKAQYDLALLGIKYVLGLVLVITFLYFLLLTFKIDKADQFKEVLIAFITFASGIIGGIFGYYYKSKD